LFAGINSSEPERLNGKNQHLRAFNVSYAGRNTSAAAREEKLEAGIQPLSQTEMFSKFKSDSAKKEGYQRLVRLSPPQAGRLGSKRIGVV
jgi:prolactin regulatory element-binding protein